MADGSLGGFFCLSVEGATARVWAALVGDGRTYLLVRDDDIEPPAGATPEIRGEGVWASLECETPLEHWTVGLEAFAVELDDPFEAWRGELGVRVGLGFDLEWEAGAPAVPEVTGDGFWQACVVHGEILVGPTERIDVVATGRRRRSWGATSAAVPAPPPPELAAVEDRTAPPLQPVQVAPLVRDGERLQYELWTTGTEAWWRLGQAG